MKNSRLAQEVKLEDEARVASFPHSPPLSVNVLSRGVESTRETSLLVNTLIFVPLLCESAQSPPTDKRNFAAGRGEARATFRSAEEA